MGDKKFERICAIILFFIPLPLWIPYIINPDDSSLAAAIIMNIIGCMLSILVWTVAGTGSSEYP